MISNPAGVWGQTSEADQVLLMMTNTSGATRTSGDIVIVDTANIPTHGVTTTAGGGNVLVLGVVSATGDDGTNLITFAAGAPMPICIAGVARVNIGAIAFVAGDFVTTGATAGVAGRTAAAGLVAATIGFSIGIALDAAAAKDANNTIRCLIKAS
jgi:hypothetical protein